MQLTTRLPRARRVAPSASGFTLIEILVTLAVVSVGMLGLAKLQAAALSESQVARQRSIIAMQAESLANSMRADRAFWADTTLATLPSFTMAAGGSGIVTTWGTAFPTRRDCQNPSLLCTKGEIAADDVFQWVRNFGPQFKTASATMACNKTTGPVSCDLSISWTEKVVAVNRTTGAESGAGVARTNTNYLVFHIEP